MINKFFLIFISIILTLTSFAATAASAISKTKDYPIVVREMIQQGDNLLNQYDPQNSLSTMDAFSQLYFEQYEGSGMELVVAAVSPAMNSKTEALFAQLIAHAGNGATLLELQKTWAGLKICFYADLNLLQNNMATTFPQAFLQALSILLREGFEALIIVTALLTYTRRSAHAEKSRVVHYGVGLALLASVLTAALFMTIFKHMGTHREAMEGIIMLFASAVLFYVSYWLFSKREAEKWQGFIRQKMSKALMTSNMFALGLASFLAVYREGAETILFYQALIIGSKGQTFAIICGFFTAGLILLIVNRLMQRASFKIPYRLFFTITAVFLYYMAFSFIGGAILELQVAGWIDMTPINNFPQVSWLGLFPAWENIGAQCLFLIPTLSLLVGWVWHKRRQARHQLSRA